MKPSFTQVKMRSVIIAVLYSQLAIVAVTTNRPAAGSEIAALTLNVIDEEASRDVQRLDVRKSASVHCTGERKSLTPEY